MYSYGKTIGTPEADADMRIIRALRAAGIRLLAALRISAGSQDDDADTRAELETHLAMQIEENVRRGMSLEEARREALLASGGLTLAVEAVRDRRGLPWIEQLVGDFRLAFRALRAKPTYMIAVILTLGLGIGANSAMFSLVNAVVLRPLPYPDPERIVSLSIRHRGEDLGVVDDRDYFAWRDGARTLTLAAYEATNGVLVLGTGPQSLRGMTITADYLSIFGVRPTLGRSFTDEEYRSSGPPVAMLGEALWRRDFGADSSILGRSITIDGEQTTIVGIVPASFVTPRPVMFWLPYRIERPSNPNEADFYHVIARLRDGFPIDATRAELVGLSNRLHASGSEAERSIAPIVMTLHERRYGDRREPLLLLFAAVGVLLLIACANLTNLAMARAMGRQREIAVRFALGAGRWRVVRWLLCETLVLSLAGAALGLGLAIASLRYIIHLSPASVGDIETVHLDAKVLAFTLSVAVMTGLVIGIVPALAAVRGDIHRALSNGSPRNTGGTRQRLARRALVITQLATALVMLMGAGLGARTFWRVLSIDPGFQPDRLVDVEVSLPSSHYSGRTAQPFFDELLSRVRSLPGVESAALTNAPPLAGGMEFAPIDSTGRPTPKTTVVSVSPGYFRTIGATVRVGRAIDSTDRSGAPKVVVVNAALAKRLFGGNAIGRTLRIGHDTGRVVGVIDDIPQHEFEGTLSGAVYWSIAQQPSSIEIHLMVRTSGANGPVEAAITRAMQSMDRTLAPPTYRRMSDMLAERIAPRKFTFVLLGIFATLAATLAVIGLYGVLAHLVASRTREIGIRIALGADPRSVTGLILRQGTLLAVVGAAIGLVVSMFAVRTLRAVVYDVSVYDPWTFIGTVSLLLVVSVVASYVPALRASRVDPVIALRAE